MRVMGPVRLAFAIALAATYVASLSIQLPPGKNLEAEIFDWGYTIYVRQGSQRLPNFFVTLNSTFAGEGRLNEIYSNFSLIGIPPTTTQWVENYPLGSTATIVEQTTVLPSGLRIVFRNEVFSADTYKVYGGYKMPLSSNSIKTTIRFTNVTGSTSIPASKGAVWYQGIVTTGMMFGQIPPFVSNSSLTLEELADPDHSPSQKILFNELTWFDQRGSLILDVLTMCELCRAENTSDCIIRKTTQLQVGPNDATHPAEFQKLLEEIAKLYNTPDPQVVALPLILSMENPDYTSPEYDIIEWDPNFRVLFDVGSSSPEDGGGGGGNVGVIAGVSVAAVVVVVGIVILIAWKMPRLRSVFMPTAEYHNSKQLRKSKLQAQLEQEAATDAEVAAQARSRTEAATNNNPHSASNSESNKRWAASSKPASVRNTSEG